MVVQGLARTTKPIALLYVTELAIAGDSLHLQDWEIPYRVASVIKANVSVSASAICVIDIGLCSRC